MFGNNNWGQNNQQQQQQQAQQPAGGLFGQPAQQQPAFGAGGAFGNPGAFGAQQQQQQPAGGLFGQPAQNTQPATGFGGFGAAPKPGFGATGGAFGATANQPATATPFGGFGVGTSNTAFGANNSNATTGGLFGRPATAAPTTFGGAPATGGGLFGAKPTTTGAFGATINPTGNGTASPPYQAFSEKEPTGTNSHYQSITCMPAYRTFSFEELRMQDYAAGRKTSAGIPGTGFGQTNAFGGNNTNTTVPATGAFGQPAAPTTGLFGQPNNNTATNAFGQPANNGTGLFGQPAQQQPAAPTGFGFGQQQNNATTGTGLFGQNAQAQQPTTGAFGQPATGGGLFGAAPTAFGQQQNQTQPQTGGLFGAGNTGTGLFGQKPATTNVFGQPAPTQPTNAFGGGFGQNAAPATTGLFGQPAQQQQQSQQQAGGFGFGGGGFGTTNNDASKGLFGGGANTQPATGLFGQPQANQENKPTGFGFSQQNQTQQQQPTSNLFGAQQPTQPAQPAGGLFGNGFGQNNQQNQTQPTAGGGLFGNTSLFAPKPTQPATAGLFGAQQTQPAAPTNNLFGSTAQAGGGLFGGFNAQSAQQQQQQQPQQQQQQTSLFGAKPIGTGLFGNTGTNQPQQAGTGLFGNSQIGGQTNTQPSLFGQSQTGLAQQGQLQPQPTMVATIDANFYSTNPLLQSSANGPAHITTVPSKVAPPLLYTKKAIPRVNAPKVGRLRGFSTPPQNSLSLGGSTSFNASLMGSPLNRPSSASSNRLGTALGGLSESASSGGLNPDAFKPKSSVKKLVLPSKVDPSSWNESVDAASRAVQAELGASASSAGGGLGLSMSAPRSKVSWDPQLGRAARESNMLAGRPSPGPGTPQTLGGLGRSQPRLSGPSPSQTFRHISEPNETPTKVPQSVMKNRDRTIDPSEKPGEYWTEPPLHKLRGQSFDALSHVEHFRVNRTGYGSIEFLRPVNLTTLKSIDDIPGTYVVFDLKECVVYPDESEKPPAGEGLNVPSRIVLTGCWPIDKSTQEPITDANNPRVAAHVKRLQKIPDAAFKDYEPVSGTWTFEVPHFTRYGLDDDFDDEDDLDEEQDVMPVSQISPIRTPPPPPLIERQLTPESVEEEVEEGSSDDEEELDVKNELARSTTRDEEGYASAPVQRPWAARLGLDPQRVNVMQASFFHTAPEPPAPVHRQSGFLNQTRRDDDIEAVVEPMGREPQPSSIPSTSALPLIPSPVRDLQIGKYSDSIAINVEASFVDAGLSLARSSRVGWGPAGQLAYVGKICGPSDSSAIISTSVTIGHMTLLSAPDDVESERALRLLRVQQHETDIESDEDGVPIATPRSSLTFGAFAALFPVKDELHEASVWRLGDALFNASDLGLSSDVSGDVRQEVQALRFKTSVSQWLEETVAHDVELQLQNETQTSAENVFRMLTGHQVERAVEAAAAGGDTFLSILVAQAGGDKSFRHMVFSQLDMWKEDVNTFIDPYYRKVLALLAGAADKLDLPSDGNTGRRQSKDDLRVALGLDWKRAFGLQLWYGTSLDERVEYAFDLYLDSFTASKESEAVARPLPWYQEAASRATGLIRWKMPHHSSLHGEEPTYDVLFRMVQLAIQQELPLESVLTPRASGPSPLDYRLSWHLYMLISVVLGRRDFGDRLEIGRGGGTDAEGDITLDRGKVGTSLKAQLLTVGYAFQLESLGKKEEAVFILLHLEQAEGRANMVKHLLARHSGEWDEDYLTADLKIPVAWIAEANGIRARYDNRLMDAYRWFLQGEQYQLAHDIAVEFLAPEAVIMSDMNLLEELFDALDPSAIVGWHEKGNLFLEYAQCKLRIEALVQSLAMDRDAVPDAAQRDQMATLQRHVPHLLEHVPKLFEYRTEKDIKQRVCLSEMMSELTRMSSALATYSGTAPRSQSYIQSSSLLSEQARLEHVQKSSLDRFLHNLEVSTYA
ncbi:hypothetical protein FRB94_008235 [Tulasnella sp. JGI-2019a]|nr:hypothetical protein FRB93_002126 [Tulasnella sp. JGI-2019a]KAG8996510.1 hypothetical protein FRB94_008235 [Tulasnella sp. JGI-2019a]